VKTWTKTRKQGVLRHRSGVYYARLYLGDKEKWFSLRTNILEVALSRFETNDEVVAVRERQVRGLPVSSKPLTFQQAKDLYLARLDGRVALDKMKPGTRTYWATVLSTIEASWKRIMEVDLATLDVGKIKTKDLEDWAKKYLETPSVRESRKASGRKTISARYFNNSLFALRSVFSEAVKAGSLHRNPAENLETARVPSTKLCLPTRKQFRALVCAIRGGAHRTATAAADMVEFLAYSGCRVLHRQS